MSRSWFGKDNECAGSIDEHGNIDKNDGSSFGWVSGGIVYDTSGKEIGEQIGSELYDFHGNHIGSV